LQFLDECNASSLESPEVATSQTQDLQLTEDHVLTQRRFIRNDDSPTATPAELAGVCLKLDSAIAALPTPPGGDDFDVKLGAGRATPSELADVSHDSRSCSKDEAPSARRVHFNSRNEQGTQPVASTSHLVGGSALVPKPPSEDRQDQVHFKSPSRHITQPVAPTSQLDEGSALVPKPPSRSRQHQAHDQSLDQQGLSSRRVSDPSPVRSRAQSVSSERGTPKESRGKRLDDLDGVSPRRVSQKGRRFVATGHSVSCSGPETAHPELVDDHYEDEDLSTSPRRKSLPALRSSSTSSSPSFETVTVNGVEQHLSRRQRALMVRGRSYSSVCSLPPLVNAADHMLEQDDDWSKIEKLTMQSPLQTPRKMPIGRREKSARASSVDAALASIHRGSASVSQISEKEMMMFAKLKKKCSLPGLVGRLLCMG